MTKDQINEIEKLRLAGIGYVRIAQQTGIPENTVKSYCRRHPMFEAGSSEQVCAFCGKLVEQHPHRKTKRFCSDKCRMKWWNSHPEQVKRKAVYDYVCPECGKAFTAYGNSGRKYCSHACYISARFGGAGHE